MAEKKEKKEKKVAQIVENPPLHELNETHKKQLLARRRKEEAAKR